MTHEAITILKNGTRVIQNCPGKLEFVAPDIKPLKQTNPNDPVIDIDVNNMECETCGDKKKVIPSGHPTDTHL